MATGRVSPFPERLKREAREQIRKVINCNQCEGQCQHRLFATNLGNRGGMSNHLHLHQDQEEEETRITLWGVTQGREGIRASGRSVISCHIKGEHFDWSG